MIQPSTRHAIDVERVGNDYCRALDVVSPLAGTRTNSPMFSRFIDATFGVPSTTNVTIGLPSSRFFQTTRNVS